MEEQFIAAEMQYLEQAKRDLVTSANAQLALLENMLQDKRKRLAQVQDAQTKTVNPFQAPESTP